MSLKTVLTIILTALVIAFFYNFYSNNHDVLREQLTVFSMSFSVIKAIIGGMIIASAIPSAYFSMQWFKANRTLKKHQKVGVKTIKENQNWNDVKALMAHGVPEKALNLAKSLKGGEKPENKVVLANLYLDNGLHQDVIDLFEREFQNDPRAEEGYLLAEAYQMTGQDERARVVWETLANRNPTDSLQAMDLLLDDALDGGKWEEAHQWAQKLLVIQPSDPDLREALTGSEYELLKRDHVENSDKKLTSRTQSFVKANPDFIPGYALLADAFMSQGQFSKAMQVFQKGFQDRNHPELLALMASQFVKSEQPEEAIRILKQISVQDSNPLASFELGCLYHRLAMYEEARETLEPLEVQLKSSAPLYLVLADTAKHLDQHEQSMQFLNKALETREVGVTLENTYDCHFCQTTVETWMDRCETCGSWNSIRRSVTPVPEGEEGPNLYS